MMRKIFKACLSYKAQFTVFVLEKDQFSKFANIYRNMHMK